MPFPFPVRPAGALLTVALVVPTAVLAPTVVVKRAEPHPVSPHVQQLALGGLDLSPARVPASTAGVRRLAGAAPVVLSEPLSTDGYRMFGITWRGASPADGPVVVTARTRTDGAWTDWFSVETMVDGGTEPSPNGRFGTVPYWAGDSDGIQVRVDAPADAPGSRPRAVRVDLIEPGTSDADAAVTEPWSGSAAMASTDRPPIVTRAEWGADESLRDRRLENSDTVQVMFVHHTAGGNTYSRNESPAVVRGLYSYYVNTLHYGDMGYNFLVDRYGTIYEGRAGSITKPVRSAATGGFNTDTMAVVAMGNFVSAPAPDAMVHSIAKILAYRLAGFHRDPFGRKVLTAEIGSSRYSSGERAKFRVISGHRDAGYTACPGDRLYQRLPEIRRLAARYMGSSLVEPSISRRTFAAGQDVDVTVRAGVLQQQGWTLTVRRMCGDAVVRTIDGQATPDAPIRVVWNGRTDGGAVAPPGRYRLTLASSGNGTRAQPWSSRVTVGVGGRTVAPALSSLGPAPAGRYVAQRPRPLVSSTAGTGVGRPLLLGSGRHVDVPVLGRAGVPATGVSAVALSVQATCASADTQLSVSPDSVRGKGARVLAVGPNHTARGFVVVRIGPDGAVRFHNRKGVIGLDASVVGYVSNAGRGGSLTPLPRQALGGASPLAVSPTAVGVDVAGRAGVPENARAAVLAIRRPGGSPVGSVWAWESGSERPSVASWRRSSGSSSVTEVVVPLGADGGIRVAADRAGQISLDVAGYVSADADRPFHAVVPQAAGGGRLAAGTATTVSVAGRAGVPRRASAVVVALSGRESSGLSRLLLWPKGGTAPARADLVVPRGTTRDTVAVVRLGQNGALRLRAEHAPARTRVQVLGWIE